MNPIFQKLISIAISPLLLLFQWSGQPQVNYDPVILDTVIAKPLGAFSQVGGLTYRLKSTIGSTNTSISLSSFKNRSDIPFTMSIINSSIGYGTISPQSSNSEFISFTGITQNSDGSATLTGVSRGLSDFYPYAASTTLASPHAGQSIFILSDSPAFFTEYAIKRNVESITGVWTYASTSLPLVEIKTTDAQLVSSGTNTLATLNYVNNVALAGAPDATGAVKGVVELANKAEQAAGTDTGGTGAALVLRSSNATSTYNACCANQATVITKATGYIDSNFIATSSTIFIFGTTTFTAATNTAPITFNGLAFGFPSTRGASSSALMDDGKGNLSWNPVTRSVATTTSPSSFGSVSVATASTTIYQNTMPSVGPNSTVRIRFNGIKFQTGDNGGGAALQRQIRIGLQYGSATSTYTATLAGSYANAIGGAGFMEFLITATSSASSQRITTSLIAPADGASDSNFGYSDTPAATFLQTNSDISQSLLIVASSSRALLSINEVTVEILKQ